MALPQTLRLGRSLHGDAAFASRALSTAAWVAIAVMLFAALADFARRPGDALAKSDFTAFYCGALVASRHGDPYALAPLQACEATVHRPAVSPPTAAIDPDPVPGYQMAFFLPFTLVPIGAAACIWTLFLIGAVVATTLITARLTGLPPIVIAAILSFIDAATSIPFGETAPVVTLGVVLAAYGLVRERGLLVLCGAGLAMLVPQVGLPMCGAIFVWCSSLRVGIVALGLLLAGISVALLGVPLNIEYLFVALPVHAIAEGTTSIQYSFAWLLHFAGIDDSLALRVASVQYVAFVAAGIALARRVERGLDTPAALALFPPAVVLIGGSFIHLQQMAVAVPFGLLLVSRTNNGFAWLALLMLALPWPAQTRTLMVGAVAIGVTIALVASRRETIETALSLAGGVALGYALIAGPVLTHIVPANPLRVVVAPGSLPHARDGDVLASAEDAREVRTEPDFAIATPRTLATRLPIWLALSLLVLLALATPIPRARFAQPVIAQRAVAR